MRWQIRAALVLCVLAVYLSLRLGGPRAASAPVERRYAEIETKLRPEAAPLATPQPGDWLAEHPESGQTFDANVASEPVRRNKKLKTIYIIELGEFTLAQRKVLATTEKYLGLFYQSPVKVLRQIPLTDVPIKFRRKRSEDTAEQIQTGYVLNYVLLKSRPEDALAHLCFTSSDLYPSERWNYVFGQATLKDRTGVWSIHRFGDPAKNDEAFSQCLKRMLHTASHETGHILSIQHCTAFECNLNGSNSLSELDRQPLHLCPVCLRKTLWNLQVDPDEYLAGLEKFCREHKLEDEVDWYAAARKTLAAPKCD